PARQRLSSPVERALRRPAPRVAMCSWSAPKPASGGLIRKAERETGSESIWRAVAPVASVRLRAGPLRQARVADADRLEIADPGRDLLLRRLEAERLLHDVKAVIAADRLEPGPLRLAGLRISRAAQLPDQDRITVLHGVDDRHLDRLGAGLHPAL